MLIKYKEVIKKRNNLKYPHKGTVVDNADPLNLHRVRVEIPGIMGGDSGLLPWITPKTKSRRKQDVPEVGDVLEIVFPYNDIYFGFYTGHWIDETTSLSVLDPDNFSSVEVWGWEDSTGNYFKVDKENESFEFSHTSGFKFTSEGGDVTVELPSNITYNVSGDATFEVGGNMTSNVGGDAVVEASGKATIDAPEVNLNNGGQGVARVNDLVDVFIPALTVNVATPAGPGSGATVPFLISGDALTKVAKGSTTVKAGG
jgi:hypothetical protein